MISESTPAPSRPDALRDVQERSARATLKIPAAGVFMPAHIPPLEVQPGLDLLVLELPPRYQPMVPNGLGYLHLILRGTSLRHQMLDANIIVYHRYHRRRLTSDRATFALPPEVPFDEDPWDGAHTPKWANAATLDYFWPDLAELLAGIERQRPRMVGISLNGLNRELAKRFVAELRRRVPETVIVVGGYDCNYPQIGPWLFNDFDYMVIGEAELTAGPLLEALARGERPRDLPGVISHYDSPDRVWRPGPLLEDFAALDFPRYEWTDLSLYKLVSNRWLYPITGSRGCHWGRCRFCAERFTFRQRRPAQIVDEIEFMLEHGFEHFQFNESDVNGDPVALHEMCSEILRRQPKLARVKMGSQIRVDRRNTAEYFQHLYRAGFRYLRFGVDGWSDHVLKCERKGYVMATVFQNLRDCHAAGIKTAVNLVLGVPGETEQDVDEMIANLVRVRNDIDVLETINTLILAHGSEYHREPEKYGIRFRGDKDELYRAHPPAVPTDLWYSEDPYIDQEVRVDRLIRLTQSAFAQGVNIGPGALLVVKDLLAAREKQGAAVGRAG